VSVKKIIIPGKISDSVEKKLMELKEEFEHHLEMINNRIKKVGYQELIAI